MALAVDPALPRHLAARLPQGVVVVTGTNGKTTTAAMLRAVLESGGWRVAHNRGGANLRSGLTTALLGEPRADVGLLEVDEATVPWAGRTLRPRLALVTNFFRDQLDRYGELETAVALVRRGLDAMAAGSVAVLCADDPIAASLAAGREHLRLVPFGAAPGLLGAGFGDTAPGGLRGGPSDAPRCPRCGGTLRYAARAYAHLGLYACSSCAFARPEPEVAIAAWTPPAGARAGEVTLRSGTGTITFPLRLPGLYNVYNAAAAAAAALALGGRPDEVAAALAAFRYAFGRMEWMEIRGHPACLALVKNPAGCSEVLRAVLEDPAPGKGLALLLNDRYADGTDVSWIWDADFEALAAAQEGFAAIVAGGTRAEDMALRLKYAGVDTERLRVRAEPEGAMDTAAAAAAPGSTVYVLPTYTAMLRARAALVRRGRVAPFWEV